MDAKSKTQFINSIPQNESVNTADSEIVQKENIINKTQNKQIELNNAFADGLPEWSLEPPQVMVRRHK